MRHRCIAAFEPAAKSDRRFECPRGRYFALQLCVHVNLARALTRCNADFTVPFAPVAKELQVNPHRRRTFQIQAHVKARQVVRYFSRLCVRLKN